MWGSTTRLLLPNFDRCNSLIFSMLINQFTVIFALFGTLVVQLSEKKHKKISSYLSVFQYVIGESENTLHPKLFLTCPISSDLKTMQIRSKSTAKIRQNSDISKFP